MRTLEAQQLDEDLGVAMRAFHGTERDRSMWASIAWRVGVEAFHFALKDKLKEDAADGTQNIRSRVPGVPQRPLPEEGRCGMTMEEIRMMEPPYTRNRWRWSAGSANGGRSSESASTASTPQAP